MASFIELPRLAFDGREQPSIYVNTADIISLVAEWHGQTRLEIRHLGTDRNTAVITTYAPLQALLNGLSDLADRPTALTWASTLKTAWGQPIKVALRDAAARERAASRS